MCGTAEKISLSDLLCLGKTKKSASWYFTRFLDSVTESVSRPPFFFFHLLLLSVGSGNCDRLSRRDVYGPICAHHNDRLFAGPRNLFLAIMNKKWNYNSQMQSPWKLVAGHTSSCYSFVSKLMFLFHGPKFDSTHLRSLVVAMIHLGMKEGVGCVAAVPVELIDE